MPPCCGGCVDAHCAATQHWRPAGTSNQKPPAANPFGNDAKDALQDLQPSAPPLQSLQPPPSFEPPTVPAAPAPATAAAAAAAAAPPQPATRRPPSGGLRGPNPRAPWGPAKDVWGDSAPVASTRPAVPRVSTKPTAVLVICYNRPKYLQRTLQSLTKYVCCECDDSK